VADALTARGLRVVAQVGVGAFRIDLGVKDEVSDRYVLGIECDGATYHSSRTARDRDRLRQQVLEHLGWRIHRIWSTDWIKDPAREIAKTLAALERARADRRDDALPAATPTLAAGPSTDGAPPDANAAPLPTSALPADQASPGVTPTVVPTAAPAAVTPIAIPYVAAVLPQYGDLDGFRQASIDGLARVVQAVVDVEGPAHQDRVMRAIAASFDIARVGSQVRARLLSAIERAATVGLVARRGDFLWPPTMGAPPVRAAGADGVARAIGEAPPEEIAAGVTAFLERAFAINREDLVSGLARELGYDRAGSRVAAAIDDVIDRMIAGDALIEVGGQVRLAR
jgi:very-short-patch-repair endonuclease